jgi:glycosyltransferase involved in cell wall biosynthesis
MKRVPTVSVVIPTFNRAATIARSLTSVLTQDGVDLEVIVVDDGSTDDTLDLLNNIDDDRLRIVSTEGRCGAPTARNRGIAASIGTWVAFQDSDDEWRPGKLKKQLQAVADMPDAEACYCQLSQRYGGSERIIPAIDGMPRFGQILGSIVRDSFISTQTLIARRQALDAIGGFDPSLPRLQDWDLVIRLAKSGVRFAFVPEPLAIAYETEGNLTSQPMKAADARDAIFAKHPDLIAKFPSAFARQYFIMASLSRKHGDKLRAAEALRRARALAPLNPKYAAFSAWSLFKG